MDLNSADDVKLKSSGGPMMRFPMWADRLWEWLSRRRRSEHMKSSSQASVVVEYVHVFTYVMFNCGLSFEYSGNRDYLFLFDINVFIGIRMTLW